MTPPRRGSLVLVVKHPPGREVRTFMKAMALALLVILFAGMSSHAAYAWPMQQRVDTQTYAVTEDVDVVVDGADADVTVTGWDSDRVEVVTKRSAWSDDDLNSLGASIEPHGDHVLVAARSGSDCMGCSLSIDVRVPAGAHVTVATASGDVSVHDAGGEVHAHSTSGDISVRNASSALEAFASSGDIDAKGLSADVDLVAGSGSITAAFAQFAHVKHVRAQSSSGDVSIVVPRGASFGIASTRSGSIDSNLRLPIHDFDSGADVSAKVGDGAATVELESNSGDIDVTMR